MLVVFTKPLNRQAKQGDVFEVVPKATQKEAFQFLKYTCVHIHQLGC
jgi:hypothetical protein